MHRNHGGSRMNVDIPDELNIPIADLARFAAEHGCYLEARFRGNHGGCMEIVMVSARERSRSSDDMPAVDLDDLRDRGPAPPF